MKTRGIKIQEEDLVAIAERYGYNFKGNEKAEFTTLLAATCNAMQFVNEMDGKSLNVLTRKSLDLTL